MQTRTIKATIVVKAPLPMVFTTFFKFDFLQIFNELWFVPDFKYLILAQHDFRPGQQHTIYFDNGATALVRLKTFLPELCFSSEVYDFVCHLSGLQSIEYVFCFSEDLPDDHRRVACEYHFKFRWRLRAFLFEIFVRGTIEKNLEKALEQRAKVLRY